MNIGTNESSSQRDQIVNFALQYVGKVRYVYGGTSLVNGVDCSGFVMRVYEHFGYKLPRTARQQSKAVKRVALSNIKKGDLIFSQ